ncbi:benzoate 4-monooxygenase cytochrome P450 [Xylogone sp. PMI_703]|nr:benzoate 4-monooxygenase cytochrome P450 [Xylogone sp. PMI_703]
MSSYQEVSDDLHNLLQNSVTALLISGLILLIISYHAAIALYNVLFHPLAGFPGPLLGRASLVWRIWHSMGGRFHVAIDKAHKKYGDVVRISPTELSFASLESWKAIYGHPVAGRETMIKSEFYDMYGSGFDSLCIGSERMPKVHSRMRKSLTAAFSTKALVEQEPIVQRCIDGFNTKLRWEGKREGGLNLTKWYEMLAFDILGEMAFGESFHCVENGKSHHWSDMITSHLFFITVLDNLRRYPIIKMIGVFLLPKLTISVRNKHSQFSRDKVARRLANKSSRKDFLTNLVEKVDNGEVSKEEMTAHASTLIIAGGETVATFLAATTYHLLKNPLVYQTLCDEIRSSFQNSSQISATSAQQLPYLQAVISEGLRIYPPGSQGFPRLSPGAEIGGRYIPTGTEVYTSAWTITHDPRYFHDPYVFKPSRWIDPSCKDVKEASQPFSLGPRGCIGRKIQQVTINHYLSFAYMEISVALSKLLYTFDLELLNHKLDWEGQSHLHVMWWKPPLPVRFHAREDLTKEKEKDTVSTGKREIQTAYE